MYVRQNKSGTPGKWFNLVKSTILLKVLSLTAYELCNLDGFIIPSTAQMETQASKPTTKAPTTHIKTTTTTTTTQKKVKTTTQEISTTMHAADMPIGTLPAMPKLLCDEHHQNNRTYK